MNKRFAAIDLGSNTILMVIAEVESNGKFTVLTDEHSIARLGEGAAQTNIICNQAQERAFDILKRYKQICDEYHTDEILAMGTSALRDAANGKEVIAKFREILGGKVEIISGEMEAEISFRGTVEDNFPSSVIDIGGGSTEFISGSNGKVYFKKSLNVGAVRLTEKFVSSHPPKQCEIMNLLEVLSNELNQIDANEIENKFYAVAGTPTTISAISQNISEFGYNKIHGDVLTIDRINDTLKLISSMTTEEIVKRYNLHPKRADVIYAGTLILKLALEHLGIEECIVSAHGLRYGILKKMIADRIK